MRRALTIAVATVVVTAFAPLNAQWFLPHRKPIGSTVHPFSPDSIRNIRFWWRTNGLSAGAVASWVDAIQGRSLGQAAGAARPSYGAGGVSFSGSQWLSNVVIDTWTTTIPVLLATNCQSYFLVFTPTTPATSFGGLMCEHDAASQGVFTKSDDHIATFFTGTSHNPLTTMTSGATMDLIITVTNTSSTAYYKNGSAITSGVDGPPGGNAFGFLGSDFNQGNLFKGAVLEIAFYSNAITASDIASLHQYATNKYGYSP